MSARVATRSFGLGLVNAIAYEVVDTAAQYANTANPVFTFMSNGQLVLITSGILITLLGWYGLNRGSLTLSAFGFELGPLLLVVGISDMIKNAMSQLPSQVRQIAYSQPTASAVSVRRYQPVPVANPATTPVGAPSPNQQAAKSYF